MEPKILLGKAGVGKTYFVENYAEENKYHLVEYNASDINSTESLDNLSSSQKRSVSGKRILYLFDEIDCLDKRASKKISLFINKCVDIPIFLTANKKEKISKDILNKCEVVEIYPKTQEEIESILREIFFDRMGFEEDVFKKMIKHSSKNCKGDIRKAKQLMLFNNTSDFEQEKLDTIQAIKMILYEEDRKLVFNYIRRISISSLYNWLYETFSINGKGNLVKVMQEINKNLYYINDTYLYSFIAFEIPKQTEKLLIKLPSPLKLSKIEKEIATKIKETYNCSSKESMQYLNLLKVIKMDKYCLTNVARKCCFNKKQLEYLGIINVEETKKVKKEVKTASLLNY